MMASRRTTCRWLLSQRETEVTSFPAAADLLVSESHRVFTPTLTGLGECKHFAHPEGDLDTRITDVVTLVQCEQLDNIILVVYSYGGIVVTDVAGWIPERVAHLVYFNTFLPATGQSIVDLLGQDSQEVRRGCLNATGVDWLLAYEPPPDGTWYDCIAASSIAPTERTTVRISCPSGLRQM